MFIVTVEERSLKYVEFLFTCKNRQKKNCHIRLSIGGRDGNKNISGENGSISMGQRIFKLNDE